ncbi:MAG: fucose isomerase [Oscillospiraceae bacterium]
MIRRGLDVKLNVKPIFFGIVHKFYYEGPCRFAKGEALTGEYERLMIEETRPQFFKDVEDNMPDCVNLLEPYYLECNDDWVVPEKLFDDITAEDIDAYIISGGIARSAVLIELGERTGKPIFQDPKTFADLTAVTAALRSRGKPAYGLRTWGEIADQMKALRVVKALRKANIMLAVRFDSNSSKSGNDTFVSLHHVTRAFGTNFRYLNLHELVDYMQPLTEGGNYTTPGRTDTPNITMEEIAQAEALADELIAGAQDVHIERDMLVNSCKAYIEVKKLLDLHDCCGFTAPCPDFCSTRRSNEEKFTFCLTHSLLNEQGIPSACEYDIDALLSMLILETLSNKEAYMGNTLPLVYENGTIRPQRRFNIEDIADVEDLHNLYTTSHSVPGRKFKGIDSEENGKYGLRHFAYDQGFGAVMRYDFTQDKGQKITLARLSPDCTKLFIGSGEIVGGGDYDIDNCNCYVVFRVKDQDDFFDKQCNVGNHLPLVYGDYTKELRLVGKALGLEVLEA